MSRPYRAGSFTFFVGSTSAELLERSEALLRDLPTPEAFDGEVECFVLTPSESSEPNRLDLTGPVIGSVTSLRLASALTMLVAGINLAALEAEPERLHLHAAAAVRDGHAVVLSAQRETGKTTTLARLALNGWGFISDEAISIGPGDTDVVGFAKPLSIKPQGRHLVPELEPHMIPSLIEVADDEVVHASLGALGAATYPSAMPRMVVLLRRPDAAPPDARASSAVVHPADAVVRLMGETMDAGRFGPTAVLELARLAARCACHEVVIGSPDSTVDLIEELFVDATPAPLPIEALTGGRSVSPAVVTVRIGDRVVIHEQPEGRVLALDPAATRIWLTLCGVPAASEIDLAGPVVAPFVEQLNALGLLRRSGSGEPNGQLR